MSRVRDPEPAAAPTMRRAAVIIVVAMVVWMLASWLGGRLGMPVAYAFALDIACLAAFAWAMIDILRVLARARRG